MSRFRAVLFDVDGTLYHQLPLRACMSVELAAASLASGSVEKSRALVRALRAYRAAHEAMRSMSITRASIAELQLEEAARRAGLAQDEVRITVEEWMHRRPLKYLLACRRRDLVPLLTDLASRGLRLGVLSDYPSEAKIEALRVRPFFSVTVCTSDRPVNALKPAPRGFLHACELWNVRPTEVLYVGDRPEVDGLGANAAGTPCAIVGHRRGRRRSRPHQTFVSRLRDIRSLLD